MKKGSSGAGIRSAELREQILLCGGRVDALEQVAIGHEATASYINALLALGGDEELVVSDGAVWLLHRVERSGHKFTSAQSRLLVELLIGSKHWPATLNLLQMLGSIQVDPEQRGELWKFIRGAITDKNGFVRAWAYNGLWVLGEQNPRLKDRVRGILEDAGAKETPAVRARIRRIMKGMGVSGRPEDVSGETPTQQ